MKNDPTASAVMDYELMKQRAADAEAEDAALREQLAQAHQERDAAVAAEREACAVIVEKHLYLTDHGYMETCEDMTEELAAAIRARTNG